MKSVAGPMTISELQALSTSQAVTGEELRSLLATLASDEEELRAYAGDCLEQLAHLRIEDVDLLSQVCLDRNPVVASWACKMLGRGGADVQRPLATALSQHASTAVKQQAALALQRVSPLTAESCTALENAAQDADPRLQRLAQQALKGESPTHP